MGVYALNLCIKGPACKALDAISSNPAAMTKLQTDLAGISGANFAGLENVLANDLLPAANYSASQIATIKAQLKEYWFDPTSPTTYFPGLDVAKPYGLGVMKVLEIALQWPTNRRMVVPKPPRDRYAQSQKPAAGHADHCDAIAGRPSG